MDLFGLLEMSELNPIIRLNDFRLVFKVLDGLHRGMRRQFLEGEDKSLSSALINHGVLVKSIRHFLCVAVFRNIRFPLFLGFLGNPIFSQDLKEDVCSLY